MKEKKIILVQVPYSEVFFDQDGNLISVIHENDAEFRDEYQSCLFAHFDINFEKKKISEKLYNLIDQGIDIGKDVSDFMDEIKTELML